MIEGICALCKNNKKLEKSHIIPNAFFKAIKRDNSGKMIEINSNLTSLVHYTSESFSEYLLCSLCEDIIEKYEKYGISVLRGEHIINLDRHNHGWTFTNINYQNFKLFLTSLIWRAAVSKQPFFSRVLIPEYLQNEARFSLLNNNPLGSLKLGCKIEKLHDPTIEYDFSLDDLKGLITAPIPRLHNKYINFLFVIEGYALEFFCPSVPFKESNKNGIFKNKKIFYVPLLSIFDFKELCIMMAIGYEKNQNRLVKLKKS